ncbi:helix-turn-helix domain-containing protein [Paenibacillus solisilvae]|uniref:Helix-turn-helix domain-containing protein n=1 Tax=Paenibacillus solisilvae TaxID=2486751 RepID=A0ABW0W3G0_9BACL
MKSSFATHHAGWIMGAHAHPTFEISIVLEGQGSFFYDGFTHALEPGHVLLIPSHCLHDYSSDSRIRFGVLEAGSMPEEVGKLFQQLVQGEAPRVLLLSSIALEQYETLFKQWLRMISGPLQEETSCLVTWTQLFILFLIQHQNSEKLQLSIAASADFIRKNLSSEISISDLAKRCRLSESAYRALFKEGYRLSPKQYLQQCRIEEAKWLLRSTNRPIQLIGEQIGFSSIHSFSAWFQKKEGSSPSDWRKSQQGQLH